MDEIPNPYAARAERLKGMEPQLVAKVRLFKTEDGGKEYPAYPGWGCPCTITQTQPFSGYDDWPLLDQAIQPGEERAEVGFVFRSPEAAEIMRRAGRFYLREGKCVGEAIVIT